MEIKITPIRFVFWGLISFFLFVLANLANTQVIPTNGWVNFFSLNTQLNGKPVSVGAVIDAYDPDGVHCGTFTVSKEGQYGFLFVYRDDALTPDMDEGASPGDTIRFKINGISARALGPEPNIWTSNGDILEVNLATNVAPLIQHPLENIVMYEDELDRVLADLDTIFFDPDDDSLRFSSQSSVSSLKDSIDDKHRVIISLAPNWYGEAVLVITADDGQARTSDTVNVVVYSVNDPPNLEAIPDTTAIEDSEFIMQIFATDVDLTQVLTFFDNTPLFDIDSINGVIRFVPGDEDLGSHAITIWVTDGVSLDSARFILTVLNVNDPPVISDIPDTSFSNDTTLILDLSQYVHDPDNPISSLQWTAQVTPGKKDSLEVRIDNHTSKATFRANPSFHGIVKVVFTVTDDSLAADSDTVMVSVHYPTSINGNMTEGIPQSYSLNQNYPNPFNTTTGIKYQLPENSEVTLRIYNLTGQLVKILIDQKLPAGIYTVHWNGIDGQGKPVASGTYLYVLKANKSVIVRKMVLLQ